jgi:hypothetical protein
VKNKIVCGPDEDHFHYKRAGARVGLDNLDEWRQEAIALCSEACIACGAIVLEVVESWEPANGMMSEEFFPDNPVLCELLSMLRQSYNDVTVCKGCYLFEARLGQPAQLV